MIQCFVNNKFKPTIEEKSMPQLLYVSKIDAEASVHPRVMHSHEDSVEIILIRSGRGEYSIAGKKQSIKAGDIIVYNSNVIHDEISGPDIKIASYCCAIGGVKLDGMRENALITDTDWPSFPSGEYLYDLEQIFEQMFKLLSSGSTNAEQTCHYLMMALISLVLAIVNTERPKEESSKDISDIAIRIKEYIDAYYREPLSLKSIADKMNISTYYLAHIFKDMTGYSPLQYIQRRRIGHAQTLLITTDLSVTEIALMVGYDNPSHFNYIFTKNVGRSPLRYRKNYSSLAQNKAKS